MVCDNFTANPFKKDICKNCQKSKSDHPQHAPVKGSDLPPCDDFTPNPFKQDFCKNCQQGKNAHTKPGPSAKELPRPNVHADPQKEVTKPAARLDQSVDKAADSSKPKAVVQTESAPDASGCYEYKEHVFKKDVCSNCSMPKGNHSSLAGATAPPSPAAAPALAKATADVAKPKPIVVETGVAPSSKGCGDFKAHAFKKETCANCSMPRGNHEGYSSETREKSHDEKKPPVVEEKRSKAVVETESAPSSSGCNEFKAHAFKKDVCVNCSMPKTNHSLPQAEAKRTEPLEEKPKPSVVSEKKPVATHEAASAADEKTLRQTVEEKRPKAVVETELAPSSAGCNDFKAHAFKKDVCVNCSMPKTNHGVESTPASKVQPVAAPPQSISRDRSSSQKEVEFEHQAPGSQLKFVCNAHYKEKLSLLFEEQEVPRALLSKCPPSESLRLLKHRETRMVYLVTHTKAMDHNPAVVRSVREVGIEEDIPESPIRTQPAKEIEAAAKPAPKPAKKDDSDDEDEPKVAPKKAEAAAKPAPKPAKKDDSDDEDTSPIKPAVKKAPAKVTQKAAFGSDSDSDDSKPASKPRVIPKVGAPPPKAQPHFIHSDSDEDEKGRTTKKKEPAAPKFTPAGGSDHHDKFRVKQPVAGFGDDDDGTTYVAPKATKVPKNLFD